MFEVVLAPDARRFYDKADRPLAQKLARCFQALRVNPRDHPNISQLHGEFKGHFRFRVGNYRVVYAINDAAQRVIVITIGHRREVYE
jgi:mRNA interferase RelE/StbE